jgi:hypothetical protein
LEAQLGVRRLVGERLRAGVDQLGRRAERQQLQTEARKSRNRSVLHLPQASPVRGVHGALLRGQVSHARR